MDPSVTVVADFTTKQARQGKVQQTDDAASCYVTMSCYLLLLWRYTDIMDRATDRTRPLHIFGSVKIDRSCWKSLLTDSSRILANITPTFKGCVSFYIKQAMMHDVLWLFAWSILTYLLTYLFQCKQSQDIMHATPWKHATPLTSSASSALATPHHSPVLTCCHCCWLSTSITICCPVSAPLHIMTLSSPH